VHQPLSECVENILNHSEVVQKTARSDIIYKHGFEVRMDILAAMTTFVRVAETGSLSAAGRDLGVSQPAVSQQMSALERHLSVRLINRTTRKLALTEAGAEYYRSARLILDAVCEAGEKAAGLNTRLTGRLRVHAPVGFGQRYIADIAIKFRQAHPDLIIDLTLDDHYVNLAEDAIDVAIRFGALAPSSLVAQRLGTLRRILVASPAYLEIFGTPTMPEHLLDHRQVRFSGAADDDMIPLVGPSGLVDVPVTPSFLANNAFALTKALKAGLGLGGAQLPLVRADLEDGSLVRVLPDFEYAPLDVHAVFVSSRFIPAKVKEFVKHVQRSVQDLW
jgi:DNA-binding transcriptional LysR family regulator